jgi:23S rRNA (adenine2503-C2)-methyltransferase
MNVHPVARLPEQWRTFLADLGERPYRAQQIFRWIHARGVLDPDKMTDLAAKVRARLAGEDIASFAKVARVHRAEDGTRKLVVETADGAGVETVLIPASDVDADAAAADIDDEDPRAVRVTQCVSTQIGCAMGCAFCASGVTGLKRNLGAHEIVAQVLFGRSHLEPGEELRNIVLMGMGEPLHNYDETAHALRLLMHPLGINMSPRRITVSTVGVVPALERLGQDFGGQIGLAISLHAADDETRTALVPINRKYPIADLVAALRAYPLAHRRRIFIEYTLIRGKNDDLAQAKALAVLLRGLPVKINLIPMNRIDGSELVPPAMNRVHAFQQILIDAGYTCFVRKRRGDDVSAACGQLALRGAP